MEVVYTQTDEKGDVEPETLSFRGNDNLEETTKEIASFSVLDIGNGNGLFLQALAKKGFSDLTRTDYSEATVELAQNLAVRDGFTSINFLADDILESKLQRQFRLINDKGTLDAIVLHPDDAVLYFILMMHLKDYLLGFCLKAHG